MKIKFFTLALAFCCCFHLQAQVQKRTVLIGTTSNLLGGVSQFGFGGAFNNAGFQFGKFKTKFGSSAGNLESEVSIASFNFTPALGLFVSDNVLIGTSVGLFLTTTKDDEDKKNTFSAIIFAPFARAYFKTEGKALPYAEVRGGILRSKFNDDDAETLPFFGVKAGAAIFLNNIVSLDFFADYNYSRDKQELQSGTEVTTAQSMFGVGIGLSVFLSKSGGDGSGD